MASVPDHEHRVLDTLLAMVIADGDVDPDELSTVSKTYAELTGTEVEMETLEWRARMRMAKSDPLALPSNVGEGLEADAKRRIFVAALSIAEADGFVLEEEEELLTRLRGALALPEQTYREVVEGRAASH
ncbi:MAG: TerB family tellurite resistance protein [Myxococcota bacterium]